jgi:hypothetical protein
MTWSRPLIRSVRPSTSAGRPSRLKSVSLTIATAARAPGAASAGVNARPRASGVPRMAKYPAVMYSVKARRVTSPSTTPTIPGACASTASNTARSPAMSR